MAAARASATGYRWDDGRILVNMDEGRKRLEHIRSDPRVALDVIDEGNWTPATRTHGATAAGSPPGSPWTGGTAGAR